jgi:hypothetical protein
MTREASGTSWQPERAGMRGLHLTPEPWTVMLHGFATLDYASEGGLRGEEQWFSTNMGMAQASRDLGQGRIGLRAMLSLEPAMGKRGYPLLLQTGETADGVNHLVDRQHPHDLFMELAATYSRRFSSSASAFVYLGLPGEPALGPPAFMHRASAVDNPVPPIGHHWMDSTHITFGVATLGLVAGDFKLEGSAFTGREPDAERWGFERPRFDSFSGRLSWSPRPELALQASYAFVKSPEQLAPDIDVHRLTASASYSRALAWGVWHSTLAWGRNARSRSLTRGNPQYPRYGPSQTSNAFLLESALSGEEHTVFARAEHDQKDELFPALDPWIVRVFPLTKLTLGYVFDLPLSWPVRPGVGISGSLSLLPEELDGEYGRRPKSVLLFGRLTLR